MCTPTLRWSNMRLSATHGITVDRLSFTSSDCRFHQWIDQRDFKAETGEKETHQVDEESERSFETRSEDLEESIEDRQGESGRLGDARGFKVKGRSAGIERTHLIGRRDAFGQSSVGIERRPSMDQAVQSQSIGQRTSNNPSISQLIDSPYYQLSHDSSDWTLTIPHTRNDDNRSNEQVSYLVFLGPLIAFLLCVMALTTLFRRRNTKRESRSLALAEHPSIPLSARIAVPIVLFTTVGLFAFSNASTGAKVQMTASVFKIELFRFSLFDFSLVNTVTDMWKAKVYPLSLVVAIWSGVWPYLKALLMLTCWFSPPALLKPDDRRRMLLALDILGKWALIDLFLMLMMTVAFHFDINTVTINHRLDNLVDVNIVVSSELGLFTFVTAVALSLVGNHILLAFHRNIVSADHVDDGRLGKVASPHIPPNGRASGGSASALDLSSFIPFSPSVQHASIAPLLGRDGHDEDDYLTEDDSPPSEEMLQYASLHMKSCVHCPDNSWFDAGTKEAAESLKGRAIREALAKRSICNYSFSAGELPPYLVNPETGLLRVRIKLLLVFAFLLIFMLILASASLDTFEFVFTGLAGTLIGIVDPSQTVRRSSLISIATNIGSDPNPRREFGLLYLQCLYLMFSFVFPIVVLIMSFAMMFLNLTLRQSKLWFYAMEVVSAWSALDVFIVAIIAAVLQINEFSHFLEGPACDPIKKVLHVKECFGVKTTLLNGCWIILAAAVTLWCYVQFIQRLAERAIADREERVLAFAHVRA